ncbi:hypothetical protein CCP4SC76_6600002 [Gammaproteobacteria bacterium]
MGLDAVRAVVDRLKGTIEIHSRPGQGCRFTLRLPTTLTTTRVFLVCVGPRHYAIPVEQVRLVRQVERQALYRLDDRQTLTLQGEPVSVAWLGHLLGQHDHSSPRPHCLLLATGEERIGVLVDEVLEELEVILKPPGTLLKRVRNVAGVCILGSGEICVVLSAADLVKTLRKLANVGTPVAETPVGDSPSLATQIKPLILLAEDSITTRTQEKRILESAGFDVVTAVDGLAAYQLLPTRPFQALVSDIEMPNLDGLALTERVRALEAYKTLPIVLVTSLARDEDKQRGLTAGADAYLTKSAFNQQILIDTLWRLM